MTSTSTTPIHQTESATDDQTRTVAMVIADHHRDTAHTGPATLVLHFTEVPPRAGIAHARAFEGPLPSPHPRALTASRSAFRGVYASEGFFSLSFSTESTPARASVSLSAV